MQSNIIGIKELQRSLKRVADAAGRGEAFTIVRGSKPVFRIEPMMPNKGKLTLEDFIRVNQFKGPKDLSQRIDEIVYGGR